MSFDVPATILISDSDASVSEAISLVLGVDGFDARTVPEPRALLASLTGNQIACVLLDLGPPPDHEGLAVLSRIGELRRPPPVIVLAGTPAIAVAIDAIKRGAVDLLEKPFSAETMLARVRHAVDNWRVQSAGFLDGLPNFPGRDLLTPRERAVLAQIAGGASNKESARKLGISPRTVEVHRAHIMDKLGVRNAADLMRVVLAPRESRQSADRRPLLGLAM